MRAAEEGLPTALAIVLVSAHAGVLALLVGSSWNAGSFLPGNITVPFILTQAQLIAAWLVFSRGRPILVWILAAAAETMLWAAMLGILGSFDSKRAVAQTIAIQFAVVAIGLGLLQISGTTLRNREQGAPGEARPRFQFSISQVLLWTTATAAMVAILGTRLNVRGGLYPKDALLLTIPALLSVITVRAMLADPPIGWLLALSISMVPAAAFVARVVDLLLARGQVDAWIYFLCLVEQQTVTIPTLLAIRACGYRLVPYRERHNSLV